MRLGRPHIVAGGRGRAAGNAQAEVQQNATLPSHADAHYELGKAYSKLGRTSEAIAELEKATVLNPKYDAAYYQLALLCQKLGNREKARYLFQNRERE
jgi:tetratricopeptide (TPR) repeat protein